MRFDGGVVARFADDAVDVALGFGDLFFDAGGVDASVVDESGEGESPDFSADGVEAGDGDDVRGVVDHDVAAEGGFEGADVAAFASDDAALHFVGGDLDDGDGGFGGDFGGDALDGGGDDVSGAGFGLVFDASFGFADEASGFVGDFLLDLLEEEFAGFVAGECADFFKSRFELVFERGGALVDVGLSLADALVALVEVAVSLFEGMVALGELFFASEDAVFDALDFNAEIAGFGFGVVAVFECLLLRFK